MVRSLAVRVSSTCVVRHTSPSWPVNERFGAILPPNREEGGGGGAMPPAYGYDNPVCLTTPSWCRSQARLRDMCRQMHKLSGVHQDRWTPVWWAERSRRLQDRLRPGRPGRRPACPAPGRLWGSSACNRRATHTRGGPVNVSACLSCARGLAA